jgi:hypothetical protein
MTKDGGDERPNPWFNPPLGDTFLPAYRELLSAQVAFVLDWWKTFGKSSKDPMAMPTLAREFWSRWGTPAAWFERDVPPAPGPRVASFVVDDVAEATPQRIVPLRTSSLMGGTPVLRSSLRHLAGKGEISADHVDATIHEEHGQQRLRVSLVSLGEVQAGLSSGALAKGLYVGAVFSSGDALTPLVVIQVLLQ